MPIFGVVRDGLMSAAVALIAVSSQRGRPAAFDRVEHLDLVPGQDFLKAVDESQSRCADDISHFPGWQLHGCELSGGSARLEKSHEEIWSRGPVQQVGSGFDEPGHSVWAEYDGQSLGIRSRGKFSNQFRVVSKPSCRETAECPSELRWFRAPASSPRESAVESHRSPRCPSLPAICGNLRRTARWQARSRHHIGVVTAPEFLERPLS
jgi:hypothetical protein